jgi:hypothetical protein
MWPAERHCPPVDGGAQGISVVLSNRIERRSSETIGIEKRS